VPAGAGKKRFGKNEPIHEGIGRRIDRSSEGEESFGKNEAIHETRHRRALVDRPAAGFAATSPPDRHWLFPAIG
jgi:hypothetical protein